MKRIKVQFLVALSSILVNCLGNSRGGRPNAILLIQLSENWLCDLTKSRLMLIDTGRRGTSGNSDVVMLVSSLMTMTILKSPAQSVIEKMFMLIEESVEIRDLSSSVVYFELHERTAFWDEACLPRHLFWEIIGNMTMHG